MRQTIHLEKQRYVSWDPPSNRASHGCGCARAMPRDVRPCAGAVRPAALCGSARGPDAEVTSADIVLRRSLRITQKVCGSVSKGQYVCLAKLDRRTLALYVATREGIFPTCAETTRFIPT